MHVIKVIDGSPVPYSLDQLRRDNPNVSFPETISNDLLAEFDVFELQMGEKPSGEVVEEVDPVLIDGQWFRQWSARDMTMEELDQHKIARAREINKIRDQKEEEGFVFNGILFNSDERSAQRILVVANSATSALIAGQPFSVTWRSKDNIEVQLSAQELLDMNNAFALHGIQLHETAKALKLEIESATSLEEVNAVAWPSEPVA